jgi:hypothetical protein
MREKRNKAWEAAKAFVETKRDKDGLLSEEDAKTYASMEQKVKDLGAEIDRMQAMEEMESQLNRPVNTPITHKPTAGNAEERKTGRSSDEYKKAMISALRSNFRNVSNGNLVIDPEQAETVKRIYREYLEGYSMDKIAAGLEADGILTGAEKTKWWTSTLNKILRNEKYIGDALLQKTYTTDFLSKTRIKNNGIVPQYYVEGNHEAIIPKEIFMQVQEELVRRRVVHTSANGRKRSYSSNHCFSQLIFCGNCGEMFRRIHWNNRGCKSIVWRCESRLQNTGIACRARTVNEEFLQSIILKAINEMILDKSGYMEILQNNIATVIRNDASASTADIDARLLELQKELLKKANNRDAYDNVADEIFQLRELKAKSETDSVLRDEKLTRITQLCDFLKGQPQEIVDFDEILVRRLIQKITVFEDHFTVEFKSGVSIDINE